MLDPRGSGEILQKVVYVMGYRKEREKEGRGGGTTSGGAGQKQDNPKDHVFPTPS